MFVTFLVECSVDPGQLIRIHIVFHSACKYMLITGIVQDDGIKNVES